MRTIVGNHNRSAKRKKVSGRLERRLPTGKQLKTPGAH
jgi:hypothetical protein